MTAVKESHAYTWSPSRDINRVISPMGCIFSSTRQSDAVSGNENLLETYMKLEREICKEEQQSPASALGHAIVKLEKIIKEIENDTTQVNQNVDHTISPLINQRNNLEDFRSLDTIDTSIKNVLIELRITNNLKLATEHEEFIANLNRKALKQRKLFWFTKRKIEIEEEAEKFGDKVQHLQMLYEHQDVILNKVLGSTFQSKIESELDKIRNYRDALLNSELCWQDAIKLAQTASVFAQAGLNSWRTINTVLGEESRFQLATETRNSMQEAALSIQTAQVILPTVQFPYCTSREIFSILQVIEYMYSDMQISERYNHATEVYKSFQKRSSALCTWLKDLMINTIHKDVEEVDRKVVELVSKLNVERAGLIQKKIGKFASNGVSMLPKSIETLPEITQT